MPPVAGCESHFSSYTSVFFLQLEYRRSIGIVSDTFWRKVSKIVWDTNFEQSIGIVTDTFFKIS